MSEYLPSTRKFFLVLVTTFFRWRSIGFSTLSRFFLNLLHLTSIGLSELSYRHILQFSLLPISCIPSRQMWNQLALTSSCGVIISGCDYFGFENLFKTDEVKIKSKRQMIIKDCFCDRNGLTCAMSGFKI